MSGPIHIGSDAEWQSLLSGTTVVITDFYADWCGPCKAIAPHFERMSKEHSRPKKVAFAKVNVDVQANIARTNSVTAMPTFKIFHNGTCVETIRGANPPALTDAINKAVSLSNGGKADDIFKTPGRTLGGDTVQGAGRPWGTTATTLLNIIVIDAYKAAEQSMFNPNRRPPPLVKNETPKSGSGSVVRPPPQESRVKTLADL